MNTEWIEHRGGLRPISDTQQVFVRLRSGVETKIAMPTSEFYWDHRSGAPESDIVAYRLAELSLWPTEDRIDAIGRNGNTGAHYTELNKWKGYPMEPSTEAVGYRPLYLEAEKRIWKMKNYFIRSVALNFILAALLAALWWLK